MQHSLYRKVLSSNTFHLEAHAVFFRLFMKGLFYPYVLQHFDKKLIFELVTHVRTCDYTVLILLHYLENQDGSGSHKLAPIASPIYPKRS